MRSISHAEARGAHRQRALGDVWARPRLSRRDRSLATVSALVALNRPDQLRSHLALARENGVTKEELVEAITHLAFYSGWPECDQRRLGREGSAPVIDCVDLEAWVGLIRSHGAELAAI